MASGTSRSERRGPHSARARLFLALDPPPEARRELARWRDALCAGRPELRPVAAEGLHVTLVFLGSRPVTEIEAIAVAAFEGVRGFEGVELGPLSVRALPPRRPRLFALDLEDPGGRCAALQAAAAGALAAAALHRPEQRRFWPHMTFARVRGGGRAGALEAGGPLPAPFRATAVVLYESLLSPHGARYEPRARLELG